jgi:hypothetical protein
LSSISAIMRARRNGGMYAPPARPANCNTNKQHALVMCVCVPGGTAGCTRHPRSLCA